MMPSRYFTDKELACPHCGVLDMDTDFLYRLDRLRERVNRPLMLNSARRCVDHNRAVGGVESSPHLIGRAADVRAMTGGERFSLVRAALDVGFRRIGVGKSFVHVDNAVEGTGHPQNVLWVY